MRMNRHVALIAILLAALAFAGEDLAWVSSAGGIDKVKAGLVQRGWTIDKEVSVATVTTLKASKGGERIKIVSAGGAITLKKENGDGVVAAVIGERNVVFDTDSLDKTIACEGDRIEVNSNHVKLTLTGDCGDLSINGNHNTVKIEGKVGKVMLLGNHNALSWKGKTKPDVANLGNDNSIRPE
jgi:hypothetical protein